MVDLSANDKTNCTVSQKKDPRHYPL